MLSSPHQPKPLTSSHSPVPVSLVAEARDVHPPTHTCLVILYASSQNWNPEKHKGLSKGRPIQIRSHSFPRTKPSEIPWPGGQEPQLGRAAGRPCGVGKELAPLRLKTSPGKVLVLCSEGEGSGGNATGSPSEGQTQTLKRNARNPSPP